MSAKYPTKSGVGKNVMGADINCGLTYVPNNDKLLEIVWYAGSGDNWTKGQKFFPNILGSLSGWVSYTRTEYKLTVSYPSTWIVPTAPWTGYDIWLNATDHMTSVVIWVVGGTDATKALVDWEKTQKIFPSITVTHGSPITILSTQYQTKLCNGKNSMGTAIKCGVTYVPYNAKLLKILWYAGTDGGYWDAWQMVFPTILTSIKAP